MLKKNQNIMLPTCPDRNILYKIMHVKKQWKRRKFCLGTAYHYVLKLFLKISCQEYQRYLGKTNINGVSLCEKQWKCIVSRTVQYSLWNAMTEI
jgi:hypothetical protein